MIPELPCLRWTILTTPTFCRRETFQTFLCPAYTLATGQGPRACHRQCPHVDLLPSHHRLLHAASVHCTFVCFIFTFAADGIFLFGMMAEMEFVERLTLREAIDRRDDSEQALSEGEKWRLFRQLLSAMLHFTSLQIIHRDLKPSNIFLSSSGTSCSISFWRRSLDWTITTKGDVRVGDFGEYRH